MISLNIKTCRRCSKSFSRTKETDWHWERKTWCGVNCRSNGVRKGRPFKERNVNWKGGRGNTTQGYIAIYQPGHPAARSRNYVLEHRLVMEKHLGRYLSRNEIVHHINGDKQDNRIENLALLSSQSEHTKQHRPTKEIKRKISNSMKGKIFSLEHRKNLSVASLLRYAK